jgi:hypothetical protein
LSRPAARSSWESCSPATTRTLIAFDSWLRAHQRILVIVGLVAGGVILILNGSLGLTGAI